MIVVTRGALSAVIVSLAALASCSDSPPPAQPAPPEHPLALAGDRETCAAVCGGDGAAVCPDTPLMWRHFAGGLMTRGEIGALGDLDGDGTSELVIGNHLAWHILSPRGDTGVFTALSRYRQSDGDAFDDLTVVKRRDGRPTVVLGLDTRVRVVTIDALDVPLAALPTKTFDIRGAFRTAVAIGQDHVLGVYDRAGERGIMLLHLDQGEVWALSDGERTYRVGAVGDVDGDGLEDFVHVPGTNGDIYLQLGSEWLVGRGQSIFRWRLDTLGHDAHYPTFASLGDINGDGGADFAVSFPRANRIYLVSGKPFAAALVAGGGQGTSDPSQFFARAPAISVHPFGDVMARTGDADFDGSPDLVVSDGPDVVQLSGRTLAVISRFTAPAGTTGFGADLVDLGDLNGDGTADPAVAVSSYDVANARWRCSPDGRYLEVADPTAAARVDCQAVGGVCRQTANAAYCASPLLVSSRCDGDTLVETWTQPDTTQKAITHDCAFEGETCFVVDGHPARCMRAEDVAAANATRPGPEYGPAVYVLADPAGCRAARVCWGNGVCDGPDQCECGAGWGGACCETRLGGASCTATGDCENGGQCLGGTCSCPPGWGGAMCETPIDCAPGRFGIGCDGTCPGLGSEPGLPAPTIVACLADADCAATCRAGDDCVCFGARCQVRCLEDGDCAGHPAEPFCGDQGHCANTRATSCSELRPVATLTDRVNGAVLGGLDFDLDGKPEIYVGVPHTDGFELDPPPLLGTACTPPGTPLEPDPCGGERLACTLGEDTTSAHFCLPIAGPPGRVDIFERDQVIATLTSDEHGDSFGWSIASPGDIDGDKLPDLVIGAPRADIDAFDRLAGVGCWDDALQAMVDCDHDDAVITTATTHIAAGAVYVYGSRRGLNWIHWTFVGDGPGMNLGFTVAGDPRFPALYDFDRDGFGDIVASAPGNANFPGHVYIWSGRTGRRLLDLPAPEGKNEGFGETVVAVPDRDGDGRPDLAVGAPGANGLRGAVLIVSSKSGAVLERREGERRDQRFGAALAVRKVGLAHTDLALVIGAPGAHEHVWFAPLACPNDASKILSCDPVVRLDGATELSGFGASLAVLPDRDRDGFDEVAIGEPFALHALEVRGRVTVVSGKDPTIVLFTREGGQDLARFGAAMSWAGDFAGDGSQDLVVASYGATRDLDQDGKDDAFVDDDDDGDSIPDVSDNCPLVANADQAATNPDVHTIGDACIDGDFERVTNGGWSFDRPLRAGRVDVIHDPLGCREELACGPHGRCDDGPIGDGACVCPDGSRVSASVALSDLAAVCADVGVACVDGQVTSAAFAATLPASRQCQGEWVRTPDGSGCVCPCDGPELAWGRNCENRCRVELLGERIVCGGDNPCLPASGCECGRFQYGEACEERLDPCSQTLDPSGAFDPEIAWVAIPDAPTLFPLAASPCANGGTCEYDGRGVNCRCPPGFFGALCQDTCPLAPSVFTPSDATPVVCAGAGTCDPDSGACVCEPGFGGPDCTVMEDACALSQCVGQETVCLNAPGTYTCLCDPRDGYGYSADCGLWPFEPCQADWLGDPVRPFAGADLRFLTEPIAMHFTSDSDRLAVPSGVTVDATARANATAQLDHLVFYAHGVYASAGSGNGWSVSVRPCAKASDCAASATGAVVFRETTGPEVGRKLARIVPPLDIAAGEWIHLDPGVTNEPGDSINRGLPTMWSAALEADDALSDFVLTNGQPGRARLLIQVEARYDHLCGAWADTDHDGDVEFEAHGVCEEDGGTLTCACDPIETGWGGAGCEVACPTTLWVENGRIVEQPCNSVTDLSVCNAAGTCDRCVEGTGARCSHGQWCDWDRAILIDQPGRHVGPLACNLPRVRADLCDAPFTPGAVRVALDNEIFDPVSGLPVALGAGPNAYTYAGPSCGDVSGAYLASTSAHGHERVLEFAFDQAMDESSEACAGGGIPGSWTVKASKIDEPLDIVRGRDFPTTAVTIEASFFWGALLLVEKLSGQDATGITAADPEHGSLVGSSAPGQGKTCRSAGTCLAADQMFGDGMRIISQRGRAYLDAHPELDDRGAVAMTRNQSYYLIVESKGELTAYVACPAPAGQPGSEGCKYVAAEFGQLVFGKPLEPVAIGSKLEVTMEPCACFPRQDACYFEGRANERKACGEDGCGTECGRPGDSPPGCLYTNPSAIGAGDRTSKFYGVCDEDLGRCFVPGESCYYPEDCSYAPGPIVLGAGGALTCKAAATTHNRDRYGFSAESCRGEHEAHGAGAPETVYRVEVAKDGWYEVRAATSFDAVVYLAREEACGPGHEPIDLHPSDHHVSFDAATCIGAVDKHVGAGDEVLVDYFARGRTYWLVVDGAKPGESGTLTVTVSEAEVTP